MAREWVRTPTSLWKNEDFTRMTSGAQRLLFYIHTQRGLSAAGCLPLLPRRWASHARGYTESAALADLDELEGAGWAWADHDQQEVLIPLLVLPAGHKQLQAALSATTAIASVRLRQVAVDQLAALGHDSHSSTAKPDSRFVRMRIAVYARDGYSCLKCGWAPLAPDPYDGRHALGEVALRADQYVVHILELDHIHPESLGGRFELSNLQTLCNWCNASKGARVA